MDVRFSYGWRLVHDGELAGANTHIAGGLHVTEIDLSKPGAQETQGVVRNWLQQRNCHAALVRPDHYVFGTAADSSQLTQLIAELKSTLNH
jgi:3-(3-hydroxy-phenyl)propionate hydroxylase